MKFVSAKTGKTICAIEPLYSEVSEPVKLNIAPLYSETSQPVKLNIALTGVAWSNDDAVVNAGGLMGFARGNTGVNAGGLVGLVDGKVGLEGFVGGNARVNFGGVMGVVEGNAKVNFGGLIGFVGGNAKVNFGGAGAGVEGNAGINASLGYSFVNKSHDYKISELLPERIAKYIPKFIGEISLPAINFGAVTNIREPDNSLTLGLINNVDETAGNGDYVSVGLINRVKTKEGKTRWKPLIAGRVSIDGVFYHSNEKSGQKAETESASPQLA